jgi:excisionase family DNA binding protein
MTKDLPPSDSSLPPSGFGLVDKVRLAKLLLVSPRTIEDWVQQKKIPHVRLGHLKIRFRLTDVKKDLDRWSVKEIS